MNGFSLRPARPAALALGLAALAFAPAARADEGMWTYDNPPLAQLKQRYGFEADAAWFDHLRLASVRFNSGGSGSFVSKDGLVMTNHHVGFESIQKLSTPERDLVKNGYAAASREQELACPDLELNELVSMENVTERVLAAAKAAKTPAEANALRRGETAKIEKEESEKTKLRCDVVSLYRGGEYWVYRYQKFTDIRLVFCPEQPMAFFGGDPDNFVYPRYDLDVTFFRVYQDGKPYQPKHFLAWNPEGAKDGDLVFVSGHPGSTGRSLTFAQMDFLRSTSYPRNLKWYAAAIGALKEYSARGGEQERRAKDMIFGLSNSEKATIGYLGGLQTPALLQRKKDEEKALREKLAADPAALAEYEAAAKAIEGAYAKLATFTDRLYWSRLSGDSAGKALALVRGVSELAKPNGERFPEWRDSSMESTKRTLFSAAPIHLDMDEVLLAKSLELATAALGKDDPFLAAALHGKSPAEAAKAALAATKMDDPAARKALFDGGAAAVAASTDSLIVLTRTVDPILRELRKKFEDEVESVETANSEAIARARFRAFGRSQAPDATFTLRLSYGAVKGYEENGAHVPWATEIGGIYAHAEKHGSKDPYALAPRWLERRAQLDPKVPFNFACTTDIIGGNSGSPVVGRDGRLVGIIFDGNLQSLPNRFVYDEVQARAVAVHSAGILEALRKVYDAQPLVSELLAK